RAGASVLVLESAPKDFRGGNSRHTRDIRYMHKAATEYVTHAYGEEEFWQDLLGVTGGATNEGLARSNLFMLGGGKAMMNAYYETANKLGVQVHYGTEVRELTISDGEFVSALAVSAGVSRLIETQAIVVAAGGFEANIAWLKEYWGEAADKKKKKKTPYNQGTLLKQLLNNGAKPVGDPRGCHAVALDARAPKFDGGIVTRLDSVPFGIVVNKKAQRFYDEGEDFWPKRYAIWGKLIAEQPDQIAYSIIDSEALPHFMPSVFPPVEAA